MKFLNNILMLIILSLLLSSANAQEIEDTSPLVPSFYTLKLSINYLDWTGRTESQTPQKDFSYVEIEGFAKWDRAEFYMYVDLENPTKNYGDTPPDSKRYVLKPILDVKIFDNVYLHIQDYMLYSKDFYVNNLVIGLAYKLETDFGLGVKPFIGPHIQGST